MQHNLHNVLFLLLMFAANAASNTNDNQKQHNHYRITATPVHR